MLIWQGKSALQMQAEIVSIVAGAGLLLALFPRIALFFKPRSPFWFGLLIILIRIFGILAFLCGFWYLADSVSDSGLINFILFILGSIGTLWIKVKFGYLIDKWFEED